MFCRTLFYKIKAIMTHTYNISGMTCTGCEAKVKHQLLLLPDVTSAEVSKDTGTATITMSKHIPDAEIKQALAQAGEKYQLTGMEHSMATDDERTWFETYKPIVLIFSYITGATLLVQLANHHFMFMQWMQHFMAGFFLVFSFFKMLDLKGFVESYVMYDVVAKRIPAWGYLYAFVELGLGVAYLTGVAPYVVNVVTLVVMSVSIIGVLQTVLNKQKIQCACLGAVFNLPMSTVTIIEDGLMIAMSATMLFML